MGLLDAYGRPITDAASMRRPDGHVLVDGEQVADTARCVHCGKHFVMVRGSGRRRGFCLKCSGMTCGAATCLACVPAERRIERREAAGKGYA
tara:strand:- start:16490 stop:16765 length:276 start_codon:yes stop_codon:yes gene_type:complete